MRKVLLFAIFGLSCAPRIMVKKPILYQDEWQEEKIEISETRPKDFQEEKFTYYVKWLGVTVGEVEFQNLGIEEYKGVNCYHVVIKARTNRILRYLFRVEDEFHSYINFEDLSPVFFKTNRKEGGYRTQDETFFDYRNRKIISYSLLDNSIKEIEMSKEVYDPLSCFYKFRTLDLDKISYVLPVVQRAKIWQIEITVIREGLLEIRKHGVQEAFLVNVRAVSGEEKAKGEGWIWFSADKRKVPLLAQVNVDIPIVGTVIATLE